MRHIAKGMAFLFSLILLSGCGGDDEAFFGDSDGGNAGPAHTIALSYPITDSIENLGGGVYRRIGKATVTDRDGRALPDGTQVRLEVIDSIIVEGVIGDGAGDSVSGTTLSDDSPMLANDTSTAFTEAAITRTTGSGDTRPIQAGDEVLFFDFASGVDKRRFVAAAPTMTNILTVTSPYSGTYPNATYPAASYIVGASLLGASVAGVDKDGNPTPGVATMDGGTATFYVAYPANVDTIMTGCGISAIDTRSLPLGSAHVYLIARADSDNGTVMTIDDRFCFSPIDGFAVEPFPTVASLSVGNTLDVDITVKDGGDKVLVPFYQGLVGAVLTGSAGITITQDQPSGTVEVYPDTSNKIITDANGVATVHITLNSGNPDDTATITFRFSTTDATVTITAQ